MLEGLRNLRDPSSIGEEFGENERSSSPSVSMCGDTYMSIDFFSDS